MDERLLAERKEYEQQLGLIGKAPESFPTQDPGDDEVLITLTVGTVALFLRQPLLALDQYSKCAARLRNGTGGWR